MKKVYMLGAALALGLSAVAAPKAELVKSQALTETATSVLEPIKNGVPVMNKVKAQGPAKAISSVKDLNGMKKWNGIIMFGQKYHSNGMLINGPQTGVSTATVGEKGNYLVMSGFPMSGCEFEMDVDWEKKEVAFPNGITVSSIDRGQGLGTEDLNIYADKFEGKVVYNEQSGLYGLENGATACEDDEMIVGKILDDGTISFEGYILMAQTPAMYAAGKADPKQNSIFLMLNTANVMFEGAKMNTPVESEYTYVGLGEYADPFFTTAFVGLPDGNVNKKAEVYTKKDGDNILVAVKNPYKNVACTVTWKDRENPNDEEQWETETYTDFWKQTKLMYSEASGDGWLLFEVFKSDKFKAYPNVAAMIQLVDCGMVRDESKAQDGSALTSFYPFNEEGMYLFSDGEDGMLSILDTWAIAEKPYSAVKDNVLTIRNTWFGVTNGPTDQYWWGQDVEHIAGTLKLPAGWDAAGGVNDIMGDVENAPVKYYNLQGIELSAPVKGQLTIRKQGNKAVKFIAK